MLCSCCCSGCCVRIKPRAKAFLNALMAPEYRQSIPRDILIVNVTTVIGTHVGPNGLGVAAVRQST